MKGVKIKLPACSIFATYLCGKSCTKRSCAVPGPQAQRPGRTVRTASSRL